MAYTPPRFSESAAAQAENINIIHTRMQMGEKKPDDHIFRVELLVDGEPRYSIEETNPGSKSELLRLIAIRVAKEGDLLFGKDQRAYRWDCCKWASAHELAVAWTTDWANVWSSPFGAESAVSGTLYEALAANCRARSGVAEELAPFGSCPGIPVEDGILIYKEGDTDTDPDVFAIYDEAYDYDDYKDEDSPWSVIPHDQTYCNTHVLPMKSEDLLSAEMPENSLLYGFLHSSLDDDQRCVIQQWLGAHLIQHTGGDAENLEKFVVLLGSGGNGKSVITELIRQLVTPGACVALSLDDINEQTVDQVEGKLAMLGTEIDGKVGLRYLKQLVSKELIAANPKWRSPYQVKPVALLTQAANVMPRLQENSDAVAERMIVLPMNQKFRESGKLIAKLGEKIGAREFDLLAAFALDGARIVIENGFKLDIPAAIKAASVDAAHHGKQVDEYSCYLEFGDYELSRKEFLNWYRGWCEEVGRKPKNWTNARDDLKEYARRENLGEITAIQKAEAGSYYELSPLGFSLPKRVALARGFRIQAGVVNQQAIGQERPQCQGKLRLKA